MLGAVIHKDCQPLLEESALSLAASIRNGALSCQEVTRFFLDRVARFEPELSSFVEVWRHRAMVAANGCDLRLRFSRALPPLFGVPVGIKDVHLVRMGRTLFGSRALPITWSPIDDRIAFICARNEQKYLVIWDLSNVDGN